MSNLKFKIPRHLDRQVIEALKGVAEDASLPDTRLVADPFQGAQNSITALLLEYEKDESLKGVFALNEAVLETISFNRNHAGRSHNLISVRRKNGELFDEVELYLQPNETGLSSVAAMNLIASAKRRLHEIRIGDAFKGFPNNEISRYLEAHDATLRRLETIQTELLFGFHERQKELDRAFAGRIAEGDKALEIRSHAGELEIAKKREILEQEAKTLEGLKAEFETRESRYARRQLRQDLLKKLAEHNQKFELTAGTKKLRWPIHIFCAVLSVFLGAMIYFTYSETAQLLENMKGDIAKLSWWHFGLLGLKQVGFLAAFLAVVWFFIRWNDRWFRQHADAEFMYKQLELDINRASWVVEVAHEWKTEQGTDISPELVETLTRNLFKEGMSRSDDTESHSDLASVILGSASSVKFKTGTGAEIEMDRKGLKKAVSETGA